MTSTHTADFSEQTHGTATMPKKSRLAEIFGELADPKFYLHLLKVAIAEVIKAAVLTFAGTVAWYVQDKISTNKAVPSFTGGPGGNGNQSNGNSSYMGHSSNSRGISGSERDSYLGKTYAPSNNFRAPTDDTFPGFGSR